MTRACEALQHERARELGVCTFIVTQTRAPIGRVSVLTVIRPDGMKLVELRH